MSPTPSDQFHAARFSPWFCRQIQHAQLQEWLAGQLELEVSARALQDLYAQLMGSQPQEQAVVMQVLRALRLRVMLWVMERDLSGRADLHEVVSAMTALADLSITQAYRTAQTAERASKPYMVIGMGKLGGGELNVSSDIDLIFVSPETDPDQIDAQTRSAKRLVRMLNDASPDFVFRVDTRLRPHGDAGPLMTTLNALEHYFFSQAHAWERYAWSKARVVTELALAPALEQITHPFVYRRYLDFDSIAQLRELKSRIGQELSRRHVKPTTTADETQQAALGNIKLGPGGIREIEFVAQLNQLIRGGREVRLRDLSTRGVLKVQAQIGLMDVPQAQGLLAAYDFLRRVEHRLQYVEDQQTHQLPQDAQALTALARSMRFDNAAAFQIQLARHRDQVHSVFRDSFNVGGELAPKEVVFTQDEQDQLNSLEQTLSELNARWLEQPRRYTLNSATRTRLELILSRAQHALMTDAANQANGVEHDLAYEAARQAMLRLQHLLEVVAQRSSYISLLAEHAGVLQRVLQLLRASAWAAQYLARHPILLDELVGNSTPAAIDGAQVGAQFQAAWVQAQHPELVQGVDVERYLTLIRETYHESIFACLLRDLDGQLSVEHLADELSLLADVALDQVLHCVCQYVIGASYDGSPPLAVIAYGKLGGKELGYMSDLDLVFLYDEQQTQFEQDVLIKIAQRLVSWLSMQTSAGRMYEIDTRLRPNGNAGLLVASFSGFERYQHEQAWVWEHQALTRARWCAGSVHLRERFEQLRSRILSQPRELDEIKQQVHAMRLKMSEGHPNKTALFDLKHDRGGMVDIEFVVQALILTYAKQHPQLLNNLGNIALLKMAAQAGLIPEPLADTCAQAYRQYRKQQHAMRLEGHDFARVSPEQFVQERTVVQQLYALVLQ